MLCRLTPLFGRMGRPLKPSRRIRKGPCGAGAGGHSSRRRDRRAPIVLRGGRKRRRHLGKAGRDVLRRSTRVNPVPFRCRLSLCSPSSPRGRRGPSPPSAASDSVPPGAVPTARAPSSTAACAAVLASRTLPPRAPSAAPFPPAPPRGRGSFMARARLQCVWGEGERGEGIQAKPRASVPYISLLRSPVFWPCALCVAPPFKNKKKKPRGGARVVRESTRRDPGNENRERGAHHTHTQEEMTKCDTLLGT